MNMRKIAAAVLLLLLTGCNDAKKVIGSWKGMNQGREIQLTFQPDGRVVGYAPVVPDKRYQDPVHEYDEWKMDLPYKVAAGVITIDGTSAHGYEFDCPYKLEGHELTLENCLFKGSFLKVE